MDSLGPVNSVVACSSAVEIPSDSIFNFYEKLKRVLENLTTFSFPVAAELDQLVDILKMRFERAIREDRFNFRTPPLFKYHLKELSSIFEQSGVAPTDSFIELSKKLEEKIETVFPSIAKVIDFTSYPESFMQIILQKIVDSINPETPIVDEAFLPDLQAIYSTVEAFFPSLAEFEELERNILIGSFQNQIYEGHILIHEKMGKGPFPYSFNEWKEKILLKLRSEETLPENSAQFLILDIYRILFSENSQTDTHVYNSFSLLMYHLSTGSIPTQFALSKRVSLLEGMVDRIPKGSLFEIRRITFIQNFVGELFNLHRFFHFPPSRELFALSDHLSRRCIDAPIPPGEFISSPEDYIDRTLKDFAASPIVFLNRSILESKAAAALSEIPKAMKAFKESLSYHLPQEQRLLYQTIQIIFFKNISLIYFNWLLEPLNYTIEEFKEKISTEISSPKKKSTATIIALKTLALAFFPDLPDD